MSDWIIEELRREDVAEVMALHLTVCAHEPEPGRFARETPDFFAQHVEDRGRIFGIRRAGALIAYGVLGLPTGSDYNFGVWAGLPDALLGEVAQVDGVAVHPEERGHGLHRTLIRHRVAAARAAGRRFIYTTVAPMNTPSRRNMLAEGFAVIALRYLFGGYPRYLMRWNVAVAEAGRRQAVPIADLTSQGALLDAGWIGVGEVFGSAEPRLAYVAPRGEEAAPQDGLEAPA